MPQSCGRESVYIAGALFFLAGIIVVIAFAVSGLVLSWGERQTRQIAAPEANAAKPACCEVLDAIKKAA